MIVGLLPTAALAAGCEEGCTHLAAIGETHYETLQAAANAAQSGDTVMLLKDIVLTKEQIEADSRLVRLHRGDSGYASNLAEGTSITFDLGGHTISFAEDVESTTCSNYRLFNVWHTNCTVKNGTIDLRTYTPVCSNEYACTAFGAFNNATLNLDVNINAEGYVVTANSGATVNFNGGNYTFGAGDTQLVFCNGNQVNFNGGTYTLNDTTYDNYPYVGQAWYKTVINTSAGKPFMFNGGTFVNFDPLCQCKPAHYTSSGLGGGKAMFKDGGTFTVGNASEAKATITRTVVCYTDWGADGTKERTYSYTSAAAAFAEAEDKDVITLLSDADLTTLLPFGKDVTIRKTKTAIVNLPLNSGYGWDTASNDAYDELRQPTILVGTTAYSTLADAAQGAKDGDTIQILKAGEYNLDDAESHSSKKLTIKGGVDGVVFKMPNNYLTLSNAEWTFENVTFQYGNANYVGLAHAKNLTYNNCTIRGLVFLYAETETFNNCKFIQESEEYCVWTYGAGTANFNNCDFQGKGKLVNVYRENGELEAAVNFTNCTFGSDTKNKSAVNIKETSNQAVLQNVVSFTNCTIKAAPNDKFPTDKNGGSKLWMVDDLASEDPATWVYVDGQVVWGFGKAFCPVMLDYQYDDKTETMSGPVGGGIYLPGAERSGYTFLGWNTRADGTGDWLEAKDWLGSGKITYRLVVTGSTTIYAQWQRNYVPSGPSYYTISVDKTEDGGVTADRKSASKGTTVTITVKPDEGYTLESLTVLDRDGNELKLTDKGNGKYTFTMPAGEVEIKASFAPEKTAQDFFTDVPVGSYYEDAVLWAVNNGITDGVGNNLFAPDLPCTRAQIVTFLWRAAGSPEPTALSVFTDVPADAYYAKAVAWAVEKGITGGVGGNKFAPDLTCTRAQAVTFLFRANGSPAISSSATFTDVAAEAYYAQAVAWAAENDVTGGIGGGLFGPDLECTRAQIATFLYRSAQD